MVLLAKIIEAVAVVLSHVLDFFFIVIIASVILSWVNADPRNVIVHAIHSITEPLYARIRRYIPSIGMFDLSPIVLLLGIQVVNIVVVDSLLIYSQKLLTS